MGQADGTWRSGPLMWWRGVQRSAVVVIVEAAAPGFSYGGAYFTSTSASRQCNVDLVASALADIGGGPRRRSAGLATLAVMRRDWDRPLGPLDRRPRSKHTESRTRS